MAVVLVVVVAMVVAVVVAVVVVAVEMVIMVVAVMMKVAMCTHCEVVEYLLSAPARQPAEKRDEELSQAE
eukprot:8164446-Karenia_brevis.AAC.1